MFSLALIQTACCSYFQDMSRVEPKEKRPTERRTDYMNQQQVMILLSRLWSECCSNWKKTPWSWPQFSWKVICGIECGCAQGGALSCVHRWNATQHPSLLSVVLWMSNPEALTPTALAIPPLYAPYPTWPSSLKQPWPYLINRASCLGLLCSKWAL